VPIAWDAPHTGEAWTEPCGGKPFKCGVVDRHNATTIYDPRNCSLRSAQNPASKWPQPSCVAASDSGGQPAASSESRQGSLGARFATFRGNARHTARRRRIATMITGPIYLIAAICSSCSFSSWPPSWIGCGMAAWPSHILRSPLGSGSAGGDVAGRRLVAGASDACVWWTCGAMAGEEIPKGVFATVVEAKTDQ
jgi:hypothetical protein